MTTIEESTLVRRAQQGDHDAYGRLANQYSGSLLGIAYSGVKNFTAAEDIAQDALLLAFENLAALKRPAKFGGWIRTIARNLCFQWRKNAAYRRDLEHENGALRARMGYGSAPTPFAVLEAEERHGQLRRALEALPDLEREALLAFYFQGKRMEAAATGAGISTAAMRKRVQRGRDRLREALNVELDAALSDAGRRERRSALLLAALASGAVYSRAGAEAVVPSGGFVTSAAGLASIAVVIVLAMVAGILASGRKAQTTYTYPDTATQAADYASDSEGATRGQQIDGTEASSAKAGSSVTELSTIPRQFGGQTASLGGTIIDASGNPVQGAEVEAIASDEHYQPRRRERNVVASAVSGVDGTYRLEGLPANVALRVRVFHPGWAVHASSIRIYDAAPPNILDAQLLEPDVLQGSVTDSVGGVLAGASVSLLAVRSTAEMAEVSADDSGSDGVYGPLLETVSDETGRFQLTNLPKGWVLAGIVAKMPGYGMGLAKSDIGERTAMQERARSYFTAWSEHHFPAPWESANITLNRGGTLSGIVFDGAGETPVPEATVRVCGYGRDTSLRYSEEVLADSSGRYEFRDLPWGGVEPIVATKGTRTSTLASQFITRGGKAVENLRLAPGGSVAGSVIDTNSARPLSNVQIRFSQDGGSGNRLVMTDNAGHFAIQNVPPGSWFVGLADNRFEDPNAYAKIDLKLPGTRANTTIYADTLLPAISLKERFEKLGGINGIVTDSNGGPVGKVHVWIQSRGTTPIDTDARGGFAFENAMPGQDVIHAVDPANYRYGHANVNVRDGKTTTVSVELDQDAGRATGTVLDSAGNALGILVPIELALGNVSRVVDADTSGRFDTGAIPPGSYTTRVNVDDLEGFRAEEPIALELEPGAFADNLQLIVNRMAGTVRGRVTDATGSPIAEIPVRIHGVSVNNIQTITDADGQYSIEPLDVDEAIITAGSPPQHGIGGEEPWAVVRRTNPNDSPQDLTVFEPGRLKMSFDFPEELGEQPGMNIIGELGYLGGLKPQTGEYELYLQPDLYHITMFDESGKILDERIQVRSGEATDLGRIAPYGDAGSVLIEITHNGSVLDSSLGEVTVLLDPVRKGRTKYTLDKDANGNYRATAVAPDEYRAVVLIQLGDEQQRVEQQEIVVTAERETSVMFDLGGGDTEITGTIALAEGEEAAVWLFDGEMPEPAPGTVLRSGETTRARARATVGAEGVYHLGGAAPGRYLLVLTKSGDDDNVVAASKIMDLAEGTPLVWDGAAQGTITPHD